MNEDENDMKFAMMQASPKNQDRDQRFSHMNTKPSYAWTERKSLINKLRGGKSDRRGTQEQILKMNEACEQKLCMLVGQSNICQETIASIQHETITRCTSEQLKALFMLDDQTHQSQSFQRKEMFQMQ